LAATPAIWIEMEAGFMTTLTKPADGTPSEMPFFPAERTCPYRPPQAHETFRNQGCLHRVTLWDGSHPWIATSYEHVKLVLADSRFSADVRHPSFPLVSGDKREKDGGTFIRLDDPQHAKHRRMLTGEFTVRAVATRSEEIRRIADTRIDEILAGPRPFDLVQTFALPLPTLAICSMLGVPYADRDTFQRFTSVNVDSAATQAEKIASVTQARAYYREIIARKRAVPGDDLVSKLVADPQGLSDDELIGMISLLVSAGHETTANQIGLGALALLQNPEQIAHLYSEPSHLDNAVEELLRYWSIVAQSPRRVALEDVEVDGQIIRQGDGIVTSLCAANRDVAGFEIPTPSDCGAPPHATQLDQLDVARPNARRHIAFGFGIHQCLGQNLARLELRTAWSVLFNRIPDLRLAVPADTLEFKQNTLVFGLHHLPVTWGEERPG
jgi:cytochrome P450